MKFKNLWVIVVLLMTGLIMMHTYNLSITTNNEFWWWMFLAGMMIPVMIAFAYKKMK